MSIGQLDFLIYPTFNIFNGFKTSTLVKEGMILVKKKIMVLIKFLYYIIFIKLTILCIQFCFLKSSHYPSKKSQTFS